jgi:SAM-dependent methyltransferase
LTDGTVAIEPLDPALGEIRAFLLDSGELVRAVASGSRRNATVRYRRAEIRYVDVRGRLRLQVTSYDDTQAHIRNVDSDGPAADEIDRLLREPFANWRVETRTEVLQLRFTKRGRAQLHRAARGEIREPDHEHNRSKRRRLDEDDELFSVLGLSTAAGRIKPSRQSKYRQVQDFLAALDTVVTDQLLDRRGVSAPSARSGRPLRLVDLGCGNAYLTFAAFRYLTSVRAVPVRAVGVDVKAAARRHNEQIAKRLGMSSAVTFIDSTITGGSVEDSPDLVLALHACDTATDDALARAVQWQAPVILAAPCCHHDVQRQIRDGTAPEPYELLTWQPILRERFADVLTDTLRAAILRLVGYRTDVIEFVDAEHTPRNVLIRAVHTDAAPTPSQVSAYQRLISDWQILPALAQRLAEDHPLLRR